MSEIAFSSKLAAASEPNSAACSATSARASTGPIAARKNWLIVPRLIGIGRRFSPRSVV